MRDNQFVLEVMGYEEWVTCTASSKRIRHLDNILSSHSSIRELIYGLSTTQLKRVSMRQFKKEIKKVITMATQQRVTISIMDYIAEQIGKIGDAISTSLEPFMRKFP